MKDAVWIKRKLAERRDALVALRENTPDSPVSFMRESLAIHIAEINSILAELEKP